LKNYLSRSCSRTIDHNFAKRLEDPKWDVTPLDHIYVQDQKYLGKG
jgi:hypothetical protein